MKIDVGMYRSKRPSNAIDNEFLLKDKSISISVLVCVDNVFDEGR